VLGELLLASHPRAILFWADGFWTGASLVAAIACGRTARSSRVAHRRKAFFFFGLACFAWFVGMVFWDIDELGRGRVTPFPALSDVGFLLLVPFLVTGIAFYGAHPASRSVTLKHLADLGMLVAALVFIAAVVYSHPVAAERVPREGLVIAAGNAVAHLCAIAFGLLVYWQRAWDPERRPLRILLAALMVKSGVTTVYGYALLMKTYEAGHEMDVFWVLTFCLVAWAAFEETWIDESKLAPAPYRITLFDTLIPAIALIAATTAGYAFRIHLTPQIARLGYAMSLLFAVCVALRTHAARLLEQHLRRQVRSKSEQLVQAQKLEAVGTLAGGIAHDFNNMLTGMMAATSVLRRSIPKEGRAATQLELLTHGIHQATDLSRRLLTLARPKTQEVGPIHPCAIVHRVAKLLRGTLPENITIEERCDEDDDAQMLGSASLLEQALLNLGINAGHATPNGGRVTLSFRTAEREHETMAYFEVADTGVGIPIPLRERIFEPFFTTREPGRGTGLGLPMVYTAAKEHGGTVELDSEVGKGSTFRLVLPYRVPKVRASIIQEATLEVPRGSETLLVVDDQDAPLIGVKTILQEAGYDVRLAWSGTEALHRLSVDTTPALVITDSVMPRMSGPELLAAMRAREDQTPVVLMTGYDGTTDDVAGFAAVLHKPFAPEELAHMVRRVLDERRPSQLPLPMEAG
jgi:signal transduction histidine kinase/ActR/RegA family two-component response regulator